MWSEERHWIDSAATLSALGWSQPRSSTSTQARSPTLTNGTVLNLHTVAGGLIWPWAPIQASPVQLNLSQTSTTPGNSLPLAATGFRAGESVTVSAPNGVSFTVAGR